MQQELQHTGGMARSHNILANETVHALSYMTAQVKRYAVFVLKEACHAILLDVIKLVAQICMMNILCQNINF